MQLLNYAPKAAFAQRHLLTLADWTGDEIYQTLSLALKLKSQQKQGIPHPLLAGKTLAMIFTKASTRTRISFEVGMGQLGGSALFLSGNDIQLGRGEPIPDMARVLSRYVDGIMIRTFDHADVEALACHGSVPVINGLTDLYHPCQVLADLLTIYEHKQRLEGLKLAFVGDAANNMAHSLMIGAAQVGMHIALAAPIGHMPNEAVLARAKAIAQETGSQITLTQNVDEAAQGADAVYTDVWTSMGMEGETQARQKLFKPYCVTQKQMHLAQKEALFLHCLPAHRGEEVEAAVIDGPQSFVFDQAENRLHAQKAVMALLMRG